MGSEQDSLRSGYKVLLGVTGCIAAYKSCEIVRGFQKRGCDVRVVMTRSATKFVGPTTFHALTGHEVGLDLFDGASDPIPHITLAQHCDLFLIAPCTGNTMAKIAHGIADDLLSSCALACTAPLMLAPAMNVHMYQNAATQANMSLLRQRGVHILDASSGYLACGDVGEGKLPPVDDIVDAAMKLLEERGASAASQKNATGLLSGKSVLITSGPTVEPIDPVRFISNRSSGKMGAALARTAISMGADVTIVSGPVTVVYPPESQVIPVTTADEMLAQVRSRASACDIAIFAAAVADFKPEHAAAEKLKKATDAQALSTLELVENPDILATIAAEKKDGQVIVGFAAETNDILSNGRAKLESKAADIIVCNEVGADKAFGKDMDAGWLITAERADEIPLMSKDDMALVILTKAAALLS